MPKISLIIFAIILISCSPQVTVTPTATIPPPTSTPIPTPTLHPDFVAVQNQLAELNENLTLLPDGTIEEQTADGGRQTIPNLHVDQNGVINIIFNNEHVVIDKSQISFDDEGLKIEGYELDDNGEWVEATLAPEDVATAILEQYSVNPESVTITETDGLVTVTDNETGSVLFETDGEVSKFGLSFAADSIASPSCEPTEFKPNDDNGLFPGSVPGRADNADRFFAYLINSFYESGISGWTGMPQQYFLVNRERQCWGRFFATNRVDEQKDKVMIYRDENGVVQVVPLLDAITWDEIYAFAGDR